VPDEPDEAEIACRRGFHQGADAAVDAAAKLARAPDGIARLREWGIGRATGLAP